MITVYFVLQAADASRDTRTRVVVAESQSLFREALRQALLDEPDISIVGEAGDDVTAADVVTRVAPDVVLLDTEIRWSPIAMHDGPPVVVLADDDSLEALVRALEAGAAGFVAKRRPLRELVEAIRAVRAGDMVVPQGLVGPLIRYLLSRQGERTAALLVVAKLSPREREVLSLLGRGVDNRTIAETLLISPQTARTHVQNILGKLRVHSRAEAASVAHRAGLAPEAVR